MFTGIIEQTGRVTRAEHERGLLRLSVSPQRMWTDLTLGESIALSGACLTVVAWTADDFTVELSQETLAKTAPHWVTGHLVNLERAMLASARFGGHIVSGHVDGVGEILSLDAQPGAYTIQVRAPRPLAKYLVPKGSVTVDGVSLTVVNVGGPGGGAELGHDDFTLWLVPHTLEVTALKDWQVGRQVNLEADQLAKYLERLMALRNPQQVGA